MTDPTSLDAAPIERQRLARERFFSGDGGRVAGAEGYGIDPAVVRGWQRCVGYGMEVERPVVFRAIQQSRLISAREHSQSLRSAASEELGQLGRALAEAGATVILTDASLVTLDVLGRSDRMGRELRTLAREGVELSERSIGSNALSIAAVEQNLSVVMNNGHFFDGNALFACAAAPLRSPTGSLLGILDVTTCRQPLPAEAPFLVSAAAKAIENRLFWQDPQHVLIRFHPRADFVDTALGAVINCTVEGEVVGANQAALTLLGLAWPLHGVRFERCFRQRFGGLLTQAGRLERFATDLVTHAGAPLFARVRMPTRLASRGHRINPSTTTEVVAPGWPPAAGAGDALPIAAASGDQAESDAAVAAPHRLREHEQRLIEQALRKHHGNLSSVARELGISRGTLYRRLKPAEKAGPQ